MLWLQLNGDSHRHEDFVSHFTHRVRGNVNIRFLFQKNALTVFYVHARPSASPVNAATSVTSQYDAHCSQIFITLRLFYGWFLVCA